MQVAVFYEKLEKGDANFIKFNKPLIGVEMEKKRLNKIKRALERKMQFLIDYGYDNFHVDYHRLIDSFHSKMVIHSIFHSFILFI